MPRHRRFWNLSGFFFRKLLTPTWSILFHFSCSALLASPACDPELPPDLAP